MKVESYICDRCGTWNTGEPPYGITVFVSVLRPDVRASFGDHGCLDLCAPCQDAVLEFASASRVTT